MNLYCSATLLKLLTDLFQNIDEIMSVNRKIIFHYPGPFYDVLDTGEKKRPKRMYEAFCELGYDVYSIIGNYSERKIKIKAIEDQLDEFEFIYSENTNLPLRFSGKRHIPIWGNADFKLYKLAYKKKIPHGVFCRDIYWLYKDFIKEVGYLKYLLALPFYLEELKLYNSYCHKVFVPSQRFIDSLIFINKRKCVSLPPAGRISQVQDTLVYNSGDSPLKFIYVGSVNPPFYDLTLLLKEIKQFNKSIKLTIVTREDVWNKFSEYYSPLPSNVEVMHITGIKLEKKIHEAHLSIIYLIETQYRKLAMPIKFFEAIGYQVPVISYGDSAVSDFIKKYDIGWVVNSNDTNIFKYLLQNPEEIENKRKNISRICSEHTWEKRAERVVEVLTC